MPAKNKSNINPNADLDDDPSPELVKLPTGANVPDTFQRVNPTITFDTFDEAVPHFSETGEIVVFEGSPYHPVDKKHLVGIRWSPVKHRMMADETPGHKFRYTSRYDPAAPVARYEYRPECTCKWALKEVWCPTKSHARKLWNGRHMPDVLRQGRMTL